MTITIDNTNCEFIITTFEGSKMYRIAGTLENKVYNTYEEVYTRLCDQVSNVESIKVMQGGTPLSKRNVKMWFKKDSANVWSFNSNVRFAFSSCYNSISNCDAFASLLFTPYIGNSCYAATSIKFCNPDVPYYITWRYSSIHIKHDNGKLINLKITPGSYDIYSLVNTINKQMGVECVFWYGFILQFQQIKFMVISGDLSYFFVSDLSHVISKEDAIKLGIPSKQLQGSHQVISKPNYDYNMLVTFQLIKTPHIKNAMICNWSVGVKLRISQLYVSDAAYNGVIQNRYKQLYFDIPSIYSCGTTSSIGIFLRYNWNCKTDDPDAFVSIDDDSKDMLIDSSLHIKNINNGVKLMTHDVLDNYVNADKPNLLLAHTEDHLDKTTNTYILKFEFTYTDKYVCTAYNPHVDTSQSVAYKQLGCACMSTDPDMCDCSNYACASKNVENFSILPEDNSNDKFDTILVLSGITIGMLLLVYSLK